MILQGFNTEEALTLADNVADGVISEKDVDDLKVLSRSGEILRYSLPALPVCWKCTAKHVGQAAAYAAEIPRYPERIIMVVGELGHAYRECPSREVSEQIRNIYTSVLDTHCVPDFTPLLKVVDREWRKSISV